MAGLNADNGVFIVFDEDNGGIPVSLKFFFHKSIITRSRRQKLADMIKDHGGQICDDMLESNIVLIDDRHPSGDRGKIRVGLGLARRPRIEVEPLGYVQKCIKKNTIMLFTTTKTIGIGGSLGGKTAFTKEDDLHLAEYIALRIPNKTERGRTGNNIYKELMEINDDWAQRHTWQSWRERYRKRQEYFDEIIDEIVEKNIEEFDENAWKEAEYYRKKSSRGISKRKNGYSQGTRKRRRLDSDDEDEDVPHSQADAPDWWDTGSVHDNNIGGEQEESNADVEQAPPVDTQRTLVPSVAPPRVNIPLRKRPSSATPISRLTQVSPEAPRHSQNVGPSTSHPEQRASSPLPEPPTPIRQPLPSSPPKRVTRARSREAQQFAEAQRERAVGRSREEPTLATQREESDEEQPDQPYFGETYQDEENVQDMLVNGLSAGTQEFAYQMEQEDMAPEPEPEEQPRTQRRQPQRRDKQRRQLSTDDEGTRQALRQRTNTLAPIPASPAIPDTQDLDPASFLARFYPEGAPPLALETPRVASSSRRRARAPPSSRRTAQSEVADPATASETDGFPLRGTRARSVRHEQATLKKIGVYTPPASSRAAKVLTRQSARRR